MAESKYLILFLSIVYLPLVVTYIYQRNHSEYKKFEWNRYNDLAVRVAIALLAFLILARVLAPKFVWAMNEGWRGYRGAGEIQFCLTWLMALHLLIFPHISKRSYWAINPTAIQLNNRYDTTIVRIGGLFLLLWVMRNTWVLIVS